MSALSVRLPDDKHDRLRNMARIRGTTSNRLIDEMATLMLAEFATDSKGNLYIAQTAQGLQKLVFRGMSAPR